MRTDFTRVVLSFALGLFLSNSASAYQPYVHPGYGWSTTPFSHALAPPSRGIHVEKDLVEDGYLIRIHLGQLRPEDIKITIDPRGIALQSVRTSRFNQTQAHGYWYEHSYTRFSRLIPLPTDADTELASMDYKAGVLQILLPRKH